MSSRRHKLLVIEDDEGLRRQLKWALSAYDVSCAGTREEAISALGRHQPAIVLQDLGLPPEAHGVEEGFATIEATHRLAPRCKIIVLTGREGREHAVRAIGLGAHDFCQKPIDADLLVTIVDRAIRLYELEAEAASTGGQTPALDGVVAASTPMLRVCAMIQKLARTDATVLLLGETGTGKERLARALHQLSRRAGKPFVPINCGAIPEPLLESELFGHERGAFTGAFERKIGQIERADGGTLFLDEIGDMPLSLQVKLLRFLQERIIERVGGRKPIPVDVRVVAATHQQLEAAMARGAFRQDLFYRIGEVSVTIPPLRERDSDSVLIATHLLQQACERNGRRGLSFAPEAVAAMEAHTWPGNVRELENRVSRASILAEGRLISAADLGLEPAGIAAAASEPGADQATAIDSAEAAQPGADDRETPGLPSLRDARLRAETQAVQRALALAGGNISKAAELLGVTRPTLYEVLNRMSLGRKR